MSDYKEFESKMKKTCEALTTQLATIRAGRAKRPSSTRLRSTTTVCRLPCSRSRPLRPPTPALLIQPWDASLLKPLEKAILASDLGINPQNDGRMIRLVFPPLTEEP